MREWYDNYCFSEDCTDVKMYNPDMVLYFVNYLSANHVVPKTLVDVNVKTDYKKLRHLIILDKRLNGNFSRIREIAENGEVVSDINMSFPAEELIDPNNFTSLLFYFGILTIDRVERGKSVLKVPNLTIRQILFSYIEQGYKDADVFKMKIIQLNKLLSGMAYDGEWRPVFEYFAEEVRAQGGGEGGADAAPGLHEPDELLCDLPGAGVEQGLRGLVDVAEFPEPSGDTVQLCGGIQVCEA